MKWKEILKVTGIPVLVASLCCLSPVVLVLLGLSTTAFAASLADTLYGEYKWVFRSVGLVLLAGSLAYYFRNSKGVCTLDEAKRRRNEILNTTLIVVAVAVVGYVVWLYGAVEIIGIVLGLW